LKVAKPLLSISILGLIVVERRIKHLRCNTLTKKRNRLEDSKGAVLLRDPEDLRHIMNAKNILGKNIFDLL